MGSFHLALRRAQPWTDKDSVQHIRWALSGLDPKSSRLRCGAFAASDGTQIPYRLWLADNPKARVLLLHGCCDYAGAYDDIAPKLARRGFSCLAIDQRGFGATASRGKFAGQARMVEDVHNAIAFFRSRTENTLPLFVLGESMGGSIAVHAAASDAAAMDGIVLLAPGALASRMRHTLYGWIMRAIGLFRSSEIVIERTDSWDLSPSSALRLLGDPMVMQAARADLLAGVFAMGYDAVETARRVQIPALTISAGKDEIMRGTCVRRLHDNLQGPKAWLALETAPHLLLHWRHGGVVLRRARRWMERQLATPAAAR